MSETRTKRWTLKPAPDAAVVEELLKSEKCPAPVAWMLAQRGMRTHAEASSFFRPSLQHLHDPFLMAGMREAVERIERALGEGERIMVYGDYDVDGTTAVTLVYSFLRRWIRDASELSFYIPDRYSEGYGISFQGIDHAEQEGVGLIIALDCGIKAHDKVDYAAERGIDMIICDHHRPSETLPAAVAVLDPLREDCDYPCKVLSGCGIGFKLMQGFAQRNNIPFSELEPLLDLVAISTACDIVPVTGENRVLMEAGLRRIQEQPRPGVKAMMELSALQNGGELRKRKPVSVNDMVFVIGPRINAAGRIEHGKQAVEMLLARDAAEANNVGLRIDKNNSDRQELDKDITRQALERFTTDTFLHDAWSTVVFDRNWHKGVIGIVASRLIERHYRPTVVLTESNGKVSGSARSVKGFDVYEAISACSDLLEQYGGHTYAAGLTMDTANVEAFRERFEQVVRATLPEALRTPEEDVDIEVSLADVNMRLLNIVSHMGPFGPGNMRPVFLVRGAVAAKDRDGNAMVRIVGEDHLKVTLCDPQRPRELFDAIAFRQGHLLDVVKAGQPFSLLFHVEDNEWNGVHRLQLNIKDIKPGVEGVVQERIVKEQNALA
ncbi:MAG: single-stranded-DNA-specific exonuclease RecJ [Flavobacteriales bacterium]|nr:single-stranded-DNA-specific exonuclease RecJ [Flavobacteriales bacterium]